MSLPPNPTDLDRLAAAWLKLQNTVNIYLPWYVARILAARNKANTTTLPPGPKPL